MSGGQGEGRERGEEGGGRGERGRHINVFVNESSVNQVALAITPLGYFHCIYYVTQQNHNHVGAPWL